MYSRCLLNSMRVSVSPFICRYRAKPEVARNVIDLYLYFYCMHDTFCINGYRATSEVACNGIEWFPWLYPYHLVYAAYRTKLDDARNVNKRCLYIYIYILFCVCYFGIYN